MNILAGLLLVVHFVNSSFGSSNSPNLFTKRGVRFQNDKISDLNECANEERIGVLMLNLGGPKTLTDVEGFLYNLFSDPDIIRLPRFLSLLQKPLAFLIARQRTPKSSEAYASIGGGSPIVAYTQAQADLVQVLLQRRGLKNAKCYFAMRYWHPFTDEVLNQIRADGINRLVVLPLYPHYSISTSGSSLKVLQQQFARLPEVWGDGRSGQISHTVVPSWYRRPGYIRAMARLVLRELLEFTEKQMEEGITVLFSAHGVPQSYIAAGDPYQRQIEECVRLVSREVGVMLRSGSSDVLRTKDGRKISGRVAAKLAGAYSNEANSPQALYGVGTVPDASRDQTTQSKVQPVKYRLSFQSRVGPVKWLQPYTDDTLRSLGEEEGVRNLAVVPVSFVSEHVETLEEIDMEYRELALQSGVRQWRRVPALNTDDLFIADLADMVVDALASPTVTVLDASPDNSDFLKSQAEVA